MSSYEELLKEVFKSFDEKAEKANEMFANAKWDYMNASMYSNVIGSRASSVLEEYIPKALDDGIITIDQSKSIIGSVMKKSSNLCADAALKAQELLNEEQKTKLKSQKANVDEVNSRILNLTKKYAGYDDHKDGDWLLKEPVQSNFTKSVVVDTMKRNIRTFANAGIKSYIKREGSGCCDYCKGLVGKYEIGDAPDNVWSFHKGCTCSIEYVTPFRSEKISFKTGDDGKITKITEEISNNSYEKKSNNDILNSGAISGARNPFGDKAKEHAEKYYGLVRSMTNDVDKISKATGFTKEDIQSVKDFIFYDKHDLGGKEPERFTPDYMMAESWRRLIDGNPQKHDLTMINHELMEKKLIIDGLSQTEAHIQTSKIYNYSKEAGEFYAKVTKYRKE